MLVQDSVYTRFVTIVVLSFCVSRRIRFACITHAGSAIERRERSLGLSGGEGVNSLKSILKMLEALAVLKYSRRKKELQLRLQRKDDGG